jgi:hypothetical protein
MPRSAALRAATRPCPRPPEQIAAP